MTEIIESNMKFCLDDDNLFYIENSKLNRSCGKGIRTVEFIYMLNNNLFFVEAKSSVPKNENIKGSKTLEEFVEEIEEKFIHSFNLFLALHINRYKTNENIGVNIQKADYSNIKFVFVLVVNGLAESKLMPLADTLNKKINKFNKIWKSNVFVFNENLAFENGLIK